MVSKASDDLPEPDKPGEDDEPVARNFQIDVLEIVLARAANRYRARAGAGGLLALRPDHFIHIGISRRVTAPRSGAHRRKPGSDANG